MVIVACIGLAGAGIVAVNVLTDSGSAKSSRSAKSRKNEKSPRKRSKTNKTSSTKSQTSPDEAKQARKALQTALDSWVFGDSHDKFMADHPDVHNVFMMKWIMRKVLMRYEIQAARPRSAGGHEFAVTLVFQSRAGGELPRSQWVTVYKNEHSKWMLAVYDK